MKTQGGTRDENFTLPVPRESLVCKVVAEGAVIFSTTDEVYFGLNEVAARVWELLPPVTATFDELCNTLVAQYPDVTPDVIRKDVRELIDEFVEHELVSFPSAANPEQSGRSDASSR